MNWTDMEALAAALQTAHPEAEPLEVTPEQLREWAATLSGSVAAEADDSTLHAVQMLWYEHYQAELQDVSG